jgi:hypothetical protein
MVAEPLLTALSPADGRTTPGCSQSCWWLNHSWLLPVILVLNHSWLLSLLLVLNHFWLLSILLVAESLLAALNPDDG